MPLGVNVVKPGNKPPKPNRTIALKGVQALFELDDVTVPPSGDVTVGLIGIDCTAVMEE